MSHLNIPNVSIRGLAATVPALRKDNLTDPLVTDAEKVLKNTGIQIRHVASESICASDLCEDAAKRLLTELKWYPEEVDCLIFVSQTPDYILPATATLLQERLGLSQGCYAIDIAMGCSGYVLGLSNIAALMQGGLFKKGLLLVGDTISRTCSPNDRSTYPLFGDAGSATALEFDKDAAEMKFSFGTDGSGKDAIIIKDGGFRSPFNSESLIRKEISDGISRTDADLVLDGMDVFSFGISKGPSSVKDLVSFFEIDMDSVDNFIFHQANLFMNEKIRKKLKIEEAKVPYSLRKFGNTSSATIPLTLVSERREALNKTSQKNIACAFGVGLSWASVYFETENLVIPEIGYLN
ncbi:3-oxoacyl-ACP synthase III family protein [Arcticibacterium luteifluviistationis]|uniref:Ketoacyl-ACP synthase III n=1 Tax=Arcticibacterium luteifluviistationis TaxID=1784714 RepID=A0A2Z4GFV5_9BACT|nr:ketoacyl-ACP synthase III [Arcticibacterium luteifluviistationis]AWV99868.1 ketoacyl-ACP synthase III [Arcticibacterium luteifluviistationis]